MLNVVVLPAPFGPSKPTISPGPTWIETPLTTRRLRYAFCRRSVTSSAWSEAASDCASCGIGCTESRVITPCSLACSPQQRQVGLIGGASRGPLCLPAWLDHRELLFRHVIKKCFGFRDLARQRAIREFRRRISGQLDRPFGDIVNRALAKRFPIFMRQLNVTDGHQLAELVRVR